MMTRATFAHSESLVALMIERVRDAGTNYYTRVWRIEMRMEQGQGDLMVVQA